jgi:large subunit ribosomal protein L17
MRHRIKGKKLRRDSAQRKALLRSLVTSFLEKERIRTTLAKAKATRPLAEKMITLAKNNSLHSRRLALRFLYKRDVVKKLFDDIGPRFSERPGGYTRIIKISPRAGDGADMALLEMVGTEFKKKEKKKTAGEKAKAIAKSKSKR